MQSDERTRRIAEAIRRTNPEAAERYLKSAGRRERIERAAEEQREVPDVPDN
jgi:hypothetical protein